MSENTSTVVDATLDNLMEAEFALKEAKRRHHIENFKAENKKQADFKLQCFYFNMIYDRIKEAKENNLNVIHVSDMIKDLGELKGLVIEALTALKYNIIDNGDVDIIKINW